MNYMVTENPESVDVKEIIDRLVEYNKSFIGGTKSMDVACYSHSPDGIKTGGIVGQVWGNWLTIKYLWVSEEFRGNGIGCTLLAKLEQCALAKGCVFSFLDTFSFQAKPFYEKYGYECQMTLENLPISTHRYYMTKKLAYAGS